MKLLCAASFLLAALVFTLQSASAQPLAGHVTLPEIKEIKKEADHAARAAVSQLESSAGQVLKKRIAAKLATKAAENADVAEEYVGLVQAGEKVSKVKAKVCADVAKNVMSAVEALAKNEVDKAGNIVDKVSNFVDEQRDFLNGAGAIFSKISNAASNTANKINIRSIKEKYAHCEGNVAMNPNSRGIGNVDCSKKGKVCVDIKENGVIHGAMCVPGKSIACKNKSKKNELTVKVGCTELCDHGSIVKTCQIRKTWLQCVNGSWAEKNGKDTYKKEIIGRCECTVRLNIPSSFNMIGECGRCMHCKNWKCVPDTCKASPSLPTDCPCV
jgi:hypothetical protein